VHLQICKLKPNLLAFSSHDKKSNAYSQQVKQFAWY